MVLTLPAGQFTAMVCNENSAFVFSFAFWGWLFYMLFGVLTPPLCPRGRVPRGGFQGLPRPSVWHWPWQSVAVLMRVFPVISRGLASPIEAVRSIGDRKNGGTR